MSNADRLIEALAGVFADEGEIEVDDALVDRMIDALRPLAAPDVAGTMSGQGTVDRGFEGVEGLRAAWADWLSTFARVRFEIEGIEEFGDNILTNARQIGTTRHGVDVEQPSAAVWMFRGDRLYRIEFHLDRDEALRRASTGSSSSGRA
jgi:hypothetical protein